MRSRRSGEVEGGGIRKRWCTASPLIVLRMRSSAPAWHSAFLDTGGMTTVFATDGDQKRESDNCVLAETG